ncbi:unnamed protein product [Pleuronectes platessa]|uniref:Uncharacterized protein n=1 Tax=Pleuronectes platessa TaxID=8262 RepID=A0A9N7Z2K0_PLEPL|nr:unnamed protein product [Pleuronectes platessa]
MNSPPSQAIEAKLSLSSRCALWWITTKTMFSPTERRFHVGDGVSRLRQVGPSEMRQAGLQVGDRLVLQRRDRLVSRLRQTGPSEMRQVGLQTELKCVFSHEMRAGPPPGDAS